MNSQTFLDQKKMTKYHLFKINIIPKTIIADIKDRTASG